MRFYLKVDLEKQDDLREFRCSNDTVFDLWNIFNNEKTGPYPFDRSDDLTEVLWKNMMR